MRNRFDSRGWNVSTERRISPDDVKSLRRQDADIDSEKLDRQFRWTMWGFVVAGIIGLLSGSPIDGIG